MSHSRITNCLLIPHARQRKPMVRASEDGIEVHLDRYAIVPLDHYEHLEKLAQIGAEHVAAAAIERARGGV